jgi:hypothetical protein
MLDAQLAEHPAYSRGVSCLFFNDAAVLLAGHDAAQEHLARYIDCELKLAFDRA